MSGDPLDRVKAFFDEPTGGEGTSPRIGRYEIVREVARGGMAVIYEAKDPELKRTVALKVLKDGNFERLHREATAAAKLRHPHVVAIHEVGPNYIAMDFVAGRTLAEVLPDVALKDRIRMLETIARTVGFAHSQGVVHRDLKPGNVLVEPGGNLVLTDFGLAKISGGEDLTRTGAVVGTPHYMAPEQVQGDVRKTGPATDVWALGVLLYEMVSEKKPFDGETALAIYDHITRNDPPALSGDLGTIAAKALEKDPARRYPDGAAMADDLKRWIEGEPIGAQRAGPARLAWKRIRKNPAAWLLGAAGTAAVVVAVVLAAVRSSERDTVLRSVRRQAELSLEAALALRRAGDNVQMRKFLAPLESAYRQALEREPGLAEVEFLMGRMHRALLDEESALEYQERALEKDPRYLPALFERTVLLSQEYGRRLKSAYDELEASDATVGIDEVERRRPDLKELRNRILETCDAFERSVVQGPARNAPGFTRACVPVLHGVRAYHQNRYEEARKLLEEAIRLDPLMEEARETLTRVVRAEVRKGMPDRQRRWNQAETLFTQGLEQDQGYLPHYFGRGRLRWSRGSWTRHRGGNPLEHYTEAEQDFARATEVNPRSSEAWAWRGKMRMYHAIYRIETDQDPKADCAKAEEYCGKAIEVDPKDYLGWMWRGSTRFYRGMYLAQKGLDAIPDFEGAEKDYTKALRVNPEAADVLKWRGRMRAWYGAALAKRGEDPSPVLAGGNQDFTDSLPRLEKDAWMWMWWSTIWSERGRWRISKGEDPEKDFEQAGEYLDRAIELGPLQMECWKHRGFLHWHRALHLESRGKQEEARRAYSDAASDFLEALSINPTLKYQIGDRMERAQKKVASLGER